MQKYDTPIFEVEDETGKIITGEILPAAKDLRRIWRDLFLENVTTKEAEMFDDHVQLFEIENKDKTEFYLILTDVKPEKEEELKKIFGAQNTPVSPDLFLARVAHAKLAKHLPITFKADTSRVFKIVT